MHRPECVTGCSPAAAAGQGHSLVSRPAQESKAEGSVRRWSELTSGQDHSLGSWRRDEEQAEKVGF